MDDIRFFEVDDDYIDFLRNVEPLLYRNKKPDQIHSRKYIGIVLQINNMNYFAPLSSYKPKHSRMKESLDFIKVKEYAVINLNNMFPAPKEKCHYVDIRSEKDEKYRILLNSEYRAIKSIQNKIRKNASQLYRLKTQNGNSIPLTKRCNNFELLETACREYQNTPCYV